jgi:hypothetical protein
MPSGAPVDNGQQAVGLKHRSMNKYKRSQSSCAFSCAYGDRLQFLVVDRIRAAFRRSSLRRFGRSRPISPLSTPRQTYFAGRSAQALTVPLKDSFSRVFERATYRSARSHLLIVLVSA